MKVFGVSAESIEAIVFRISATEYDGNLMIKDITDVSNSRGPRTTFTLTVRSSRDKGARTSTSPGQGHNGLRRIAAACWHTHWDVLAELFRQFPSARVVTALATYTAPTFHDAALATWSQNVGSVMDPHAIGSLCSCEHWTNGLATGVRVEYPSRAAGTPIPVTVYSGAYGHDYEETLTGMRGAAQWYAHGRDDEGEPLPWLTGAKS